MIPEIQSYHIRLLQSSNICDIASFDVYKAYKKEFPQKLKLHGIDRVKYIDIMKDFNTILIREELIDKAKPISLPFRLGTLWIQKRKFNFTNRRGLKIDYSESKRLKTTIYFLNEHTDNYYYTFRWQKARTRIKGKDRYAFKVCNSHKRYLSKSLKNEDRTVDHFEYLA
jgi:hypothetical protein